MLGLVSAIQPVLKASVLFEVIVETVDLMTGRISTMLPFALLVNTIWHPVTQLDLDLTLAHSKNRRRLELAMVDILRRHASPHGSVMMTSLP